MKPKQYNFSHFSISHSQDCICCVINKTSAVGIDVEKIKSLSENIIQKYNLKQSKISPITSWTQKEAVLKVNPDNTLHDLKNIKLEDNSALFKSQRYHLKSFSLGKEFTMSIASAERHSKIKLKRVYF